MRIGLPGFDRLDLAKLFGAYMDAKDKPPAQAAQPVRLQFKFVDSFETSNNGAQQWLVRREAAENVGGAAKINAARPQGTSAGERVTRTLFSDAFERPRVMPVSLRFAPAQNQDNGQHGMQDNGFRASTADF